MLRTRIITALVLIGAFLTALFWLPPIGWLAFSSMVAALAAWEWGALIGLRMWGRVLLGVAIALVAVSISLASPGSVGLAPHSSDTAMLLGKWFYYPSALFWLFVVPWWLKSRWAMKGSVIGVAVGAVVILPTWLALVQIRQAGELVLIAIMAVVWLADIAAYFSGRRFGRHKLAPAISPGKTWEGALGGTFAVVAYGFVSVSALPSSLGENRALLFLLLVALAAISIMGDLFESLLKRQAGLKDSSGILPGHGGVLDRIDSLTSTLPIAAIVLHYFSV